MQRRHIPVAVEIGMVPAGTDCGGGEGYANPGMVDRVGAHLQRLGLRLDYMAMDEPVWMAHERSWGRSFKGLPDCQYTLDAVAQGVAQNVAAMRRYYPAVRVGEIEVVGTRLDPRRVFADYGTFARLFERYTGTPCGCRLAERLATTDSTAEAASTRAWPTVRRHHRWRSGQ
jgi:hypothetical protein